MSKKSHGKAAGSVPGAPPPSATAGWYPDPNGLPNLLWWDGQSWTSRSKPGTRSKQPGTRPSAASEVGRSNVPANIGFSLGVASLFLFAVPFLGLAITVGAALISLLGLSEHTPKHARSGKVLAIIGLCLGIVYTFMVVLYATTDRF